MTKLNLSLSDRTITTENGAWFKNWFDSSFYHQLYSNRDENEAAGFIDELICELNPKPGSAMLDLGCGSGRHSKILAGKGFDVTGFDLAGSSIATAKRFEKSNLNFYRHDMREPFGRNLYDYVFNFFTSFGYFKCDEDNHKVIRNIQQSLKPGGVLMMDYLNVQYSDKHMMAEETKEIDGVIYHIHRWTDEDYFYKKICIESGADEPIVHTEQVARLGLSDFYELFVQHGMMIEQIYGDYRLGAYDREKSPRLIMLVKRMESVFE